MANKKQSSSKSNSSRYARAKRYGRKSTTILVIVLIVLVALGLCGFRFAYSAMLPDVIEMSEVEATELLKEYGMEVQVQKDWSDKYDEGMVMTQEPKGGAHASPGDTVTIVISKGPESVSMPELVGVSQEEAVNNLSKAGVSWLVSEAYSDEVAAGTVISQIPEAGIEVAPGENVHLVISKGVKPEVRTADDVEVTKRETPSTDSDRETTSTTSRTTTTTSDDDDDEDEEVTTTTTTTTSNTTDNSTTQSSQSSTSQSTTNNTTKNTKTTTPTDDTASTDNSASTGDPGLDELIESNE